MIYRLILITSILHIVVHNGSSQEPVAWGDDLVFHTFSIAAIDRETGEVGVAVTTRNPCVGNGVPWVRAGIGAVATQASTRTEYGNELLDMLEKGMSATDALRSAMSTDERAANRQIGVIGLSGGSAQHTGSETRAWSGHLSGPTYVTQGNLLVGSVVVEAVAASFESTESRGRHLADRLISALEAGQQMGGDARKGRVQSAAVIVADPREGHSRRQDKISTHINVCEHRSPVSELRRIYDSVSQTLGYRTLQQFTGRDVMQLKIMLHALDMYRSGKGLESGSNAMRYTEDLVNAVEVFRKSEGLSTGESGSPSGLVDSETVIRLWEQLDRKGLSSAIREQIKEITSITR